MSTRKPKSQRKEDLRKKNLGIGIGKINAAAAESPKTNKILFQDDFVASDYDSDENDKEALEQNDDDSEDYDEDDDEFSDDDEVEQVSASAAKQQAMDMRAAERKTRIEEAAISQKRKRKTKEIPKPVQPDSDDEDELDDDFLAMVDEERVNEAKSKRMNKEKSSGKNKLGRHTTFVSEADDPNAPGSITAPIVADHNIEVVVLPGLSAEDRGDDGDRHVLSLSSGLGTEPSGTALLFCRGSQSQALRNKATPEKGFEVKRSRKMKYGLTRGKPSSNFAVRQRR